MYNRGMEGRKGYPKQAKPKKDSGDERLVFWQKLMQNLSKGGKMNSHVILWIKKECPYSVLGYVKQACGQGTMHQCAAFWKCHGDSK